MKRSLLALSLALSATVLAVGCAAPTSSSAPAAKAPAAPVAKWTCSAQGLVASSYNGGRTAYVQLAGFSMGSSYSVEKDPSGKKATGKTQNGTTFTCVTS